VGERGRLVPDPEQQEAIRLIHALRVEGASLGAISANLAQSGQSPQPYCRAQHSR
jgi:hypothetical protein